jgi:flagellar basal-body rod modification protein FlgD
MSTSATSSTSSTLSSLYNNASSSTLATTQSSQDLKNEFLQMLITQLKNQDPTNPVDDTAMLSEEAQFSTLEQMQNMNTNLVSLMSMQNVSQAVSLVGKTVTGTNTSGVTDTSLVTGITFNNGTPSLSLQDGNSMSLSDITSIASD